MHDEAPDQHAERQYDDWQQDTQHVLAAIARLGRGGAGAHATPALADAAANASEACRHSARVFRRRAEALVARIGCVDAQFGEHAAWSRRHHHDALRQVDRLEHRVRNEDDGLAECVPERQQIVVELEAGDLVERRERLVHE